MKNHFKANIIPILLGIVIFAFEIISPFQSGSIMIVSSFLLTAICAVLLLHFTKSYSPCGWFTLSNCGTMLIALGVITIAEPRIHFDYEVAYMLMANWGGVTVTCFAVKLFQIKKPLPGFQSFFQLSSVIFAFVYLFILMYSLFFKYYDLGTWSDVNLIPFKTIIPYLTGTVIANSNVMVINLIGNILLFTPLGFYAGILRKHHLLYSISALLAIPLLIEILQHLTRTGIADIDDLLLNFIGGLLGILAHRVLEKLYQHIHKDATARILIL